MKSRKRKLFALVFAVALMVNSTTAFAAYGSGTINGTTSKGWAWTGQYNISTAEVFGSVSCPKAHDVAASAQVYYKEGLTVKTANPFNSQDPGTYAAVRWTAGSGRTVQSNSCVHLDVGTDRVY